MRKRGLSEKVVWAYNPLPDVDDAEILRRATLTLMQPKVKHPFELRWQYAGGEEQEIVRLLPGEFHPLRVTEAAEMEREMREVGCVLVNDPNDPNEVLGKAEVGLRAAHRFWRERGAPQLQKFRQRAGITTEEMEERKSELWAYHVAKAKAEAVEERLKQVIKQRAELGAGADEAKVSVRAKKAAAA